MSMLFNFKLSLHNFDFDVRADRFLHYDKTLNNAYNDVFDELVELEDEIGQFGIKMNQKSVGENLWVENL